MVSCVRGAPPTIRCIQVFAVEIYHLNMRCSVVDPVAD